MNRMNIGGRSLEIKCFGNLPSGRPALVFLHEGLGSISQWRNFPEQVHERTGCPAIVYNRAGYGLSDEAELPRRLDFMHREANYVLPQLLNQLKLKQVLLIGHSDGGSIALIHSANANTSVLALILLAPHVFVEEITLLSIMKAKKEYLQGSLKRRLARHHRFTDHTFLGWADAWLNPEFRSWNIESYLPAIRVPVLVIQGEEDPYGTTCQIESIREKCAGPVDVFLIPKCGHQPHVERTQETLERVVGFIQQNI